MYEETTIAAIATSPGEGGIGIIRISGMQAADVADRVFHTKKIKSFHEAEPYRMYFGRVVEGDRQVDEGLAVYMRSPHSYTSWRSRSTARWRRSARRSRSFWKRGPSPRTAVNSRSGPS